MSELSPEIEAQVQAVLATDKGLPVAEPSLLQQEEYLSKFSWSGLFYNVFYYGAMKDKLFTTLSIVFSLFLFTLPLLVLLAFFARRRAWEKRTWFNFNEYQAVQQKWDRSILWGVMGTILASWIILQLMNWALHSVLQSAGIPSSGSSTQDLQQVQQQLQELQSDDGSGGTTAPTASPTDENLQQLKSQLQELQDE